MARNFAKDVLLGVMIEQLIAFSPLLVIGGIGGLAYYSFKSGPIQDRVVLLPGPDGQVGEVLVKSADGERMLKTAYAVVGADANGKLVSETQSEEYVKTRYGLTLDARPPRPKSFTVYFTSGSATELDVDSRSLILTIRYVLADRPAPEITVIGHTDTVGGLEANDALSLERATTIRDQMVAVGINAASIEVAGRGERELLIPTDDEVDTPSNRRVEISIR